MKQECDSENCAVNTAGRFCSSEYARNRRADGVLIRDVPAPSTIQTPPSTTHPIVVGGAIARSGVVTANPATTVAEPIIITRRSGNEASNRGITSATAMEPAPKHPSANATPVIDPANSRRRTPTYSPTPTRAPAPPPMSKPTTRAGPGSGNWQSQRQDSQT